MKPPSPAPRILVACRLTTLGILLGRTVSKPAAASIITDTPVSSSNASQDSISTGAPKGDTTIIAPGRRFPHIIVSRTWSASSAQVCGSTSKNQGVSPAALAECAVAANVQDGMMQSDPRGTSRAKSAAVKPAVQFAVVTTEAPPRRADNCSSRLVTSGPQFEYQRFASILSRYGRISAAVGSFGFITGIDGAPRRLSWACHRPECAKFAYRLPRVRWYDCEVYCLKWSERYLRMASRSSGLILAPQPVILFTSLSHCAGVRRCWRIMLSSWQAMQAAS